MSITAETHDCRDAGGRVTQGAVTEKGAEKKQNNSPQRHKGRKGKGRDKTRTPDLHLDIGDRFFTIISLCAFAVTMFCFSLRWGEDYNRSGLSSIRAMVFCNAWYTNQVSNRDPALLAMCPPHVTLYQKGDSTHVVFMRPTHSGQGSDAMKLLEELEVDVSRAIEAGIETAGR